MPGVAILPVSPALPAFPSPISKMQNGSSSSRRDSISSIKAAAKEQAQKVRGASATSLLKSARDQILRARTFETEGDLREALASYTKAASLAQMFLDTSEVKQETAPGKRGVLTKEFMSFQQNEGKILGTQMHSVEARLLEIENSRVNDSDKEPSDGLARKPGGSIADRMRALQNAGLTVSPTSKRMSKELQSAPSVPAASSPILPSPIELPSKPQSHRISLQGLPPPIAPSPSITSAGQGSPALTASASASAAPSPHTLIPASSFGPPSPTSSASSSPQMDNRLSITEFTHNFPSIDELDEMDGLKLSNVPTVKSVGTGSNKVSHLDGSGEHLHLSHHQPPVVRHSPTPPSKAFPTLPLDIGPRPSSTPIPTIDTHTFASRPASPSRSPLSPSVPKKPSNLALNQAQRPLFVPPLATEKKDIPFTTLFPKILHEWKGKSNFQVLILDIRTRQEFETEHIKADAVVCIEPSVLLRENVTSETIENALNVAPRNERLLFVNRDKFELVAFYDNSSTSLVANPALQALTRAIYEMEFRSGRFLRNVPMLLVGGLKAWKEDLGSEEVVRGGTETTLEVPASEANVLSAEISMNTDSGAFGPALDGVGNPNLSAPLMPTPFTPLSPPSLNPPVHINGHSRLPAESLTSSPYSPSLTSDPAILTSAKNNIDGTDSGANKYTMWVPPSSASPLDPTTINNNPSRSLPVMAPSPDGTLSGTKGLARKPAISRPSSQSISHSHIPPENVPSHRSSPSIANVTNSTPIQYPSFARTSTSSASASASASPQVSGSPFPSYYQNGTSLNAVGVAPPPQASINPSPLSRRRSDFTYGSGYGSGYVDGSQEPFSTASSLAGVRPRIDYPDLPLSSQHVLRLPPAAASTSIDRERMDNRPRLVAQQSGLTSQTSGHPSTGTGHPASIPRPPTISSDYPVTYWPDLQIGTSGLRNMGNTCYMNSTIQCLSATVPFARFFTDGRWKSAVNMVNPMGTKGALAQAFANILRDMWQGEMASLTPLPFRRTVCTYAKQFSGSEQHDSQEFLSVLLDGLHEDLNRVLNKPVIEMTPEREAELEVLPTQIGSEQQWQLYRMRDDSLVVDFFQGQYKNRLECLTCHKTSTTYNTFMYLTLPIPTTRGLSKITIQQCLDAFVKEEVLEKSNAWNCPNCKTLRKATKTLSLSRLPPVLLIHLKRFSVKGHFTEKIETCVDFPLRGLDLTNYMPPPLPPGAVGAPQTHLLDDPRAQFPPYRYDLYGVTNHFGTLSSGHYTAFIASRGSWLYCDDSRITPTDPKDVVGKPAYILYYKRTRV